MLRTATGLILAAASLACAAEEAYSDRYSACMDKSGGVTVEMLDCMAAETAAQDSKLNQAYGKLGAQLTPARKRQLVAAQRLWVQYRDANCGFYADPDGGTAASLAASGCVMRETAGRASELEILAQANDR
jgi:uncharacterized protein YecT (DUF1311 family)